MGRGGRTGIASLPKAQAEPASGGAPTVSGGVRPSSTDEWEMPVSTDSNESSDLTADASAKEVFYEFDEEAVQVSEVAELHQKNMQLQQKLDDQSQIVENLRTENTRLLRLNMNLQEMLQQKPEGAGFSDISGYPDSEWLMKISQVANDSDHIFVKNLLFRLFPGGVSNATVSGRKSNNPYGRNKKTNETEKERTSHPSDPPQLDPAKVNYIKGKLHVTLLNCINY